MRLHFLGANRQVTGSRYYVESDGARVLVDCGMFQERDYQDRNWEPSPIEPKKIDAILLTHAHLDHCGLIPKLVREGFRGPIFATEPTVDLAELILRDSAHIQEEDMAFKRKRHRKEGRKGRHPELVLYTPGDVERAMPRFRAVEYGQPVKLNGHMSVTFHDAGHILGSATLELSVRHNGRSDRMLFSGDLGRRDIPLLNDPTLFDQADYVVMESTYGDRDHPQEVDIETQMADVITATVKRGGNVVIPTFAVERAQELMYHISRLIHDERIPRVPIFLDSPMAIHVTDVFEQHRECLDQDTLGRMHAGQSPLRFPGLTLTSTVEESKRINELTEPAIILAPSGMCTAGRIKHHLKHNITRPEATILFVGFQVRGTLGRQILEGNPQVRIHGRQWPVRAQVAQIHGFSGHADRTSLMRWLKHFKSPPRHLFLTHGEDDVSCALAQEVRGVLGWPVTVPAYQQRIDLD